MSSVLTNECPEAPWIHCPSDILILIFKRLHIKSLINCMHVSKPWSETVHYYCQCPSLVLYSGPNNISFKAFTSFDINKNERLPKGERISIDYAETSSLVAEVTVPSFVVIWYKLLHLRNKLHSNACDCTDRNEEFLFNISFFKVQDNACYVIDNKNIIWVFTAYECSWNCDVLAKYKGNKDTICTLHIHDGDVYILQKTGAILKVDSKCRKLEKILQIPPCIFHTPAFMFHECSVVVKLANDKTNDLFKPHRVKKQTLLRFPGVTCIMEHGPVLITGRENGKIDIFLIDNLFNTKPKPISTFYLQSYVNARSFHIISMDVYESTDGHHLFIATENSIYELLIT